ncbi:MAG: toxin-antitoxin system HicB family antitoxin [Chloroflexi bacterium]|nr:MAG: toxin-antitoxin system HicB family antitoxin [Chloroflexota bacterium]
MRQLLARIDDDLHRRLKRRAAAQGRSVNAMVTEILRDAVARPDGPELLRARLRALGRLAEIPRPRRALSRNAAIALTRGAGDAVSRALAEDRRRP